MKICTHRLTLDDDGALPYRPTPPVGTGIAPRFLVDGEVNGGMDIVGWYHSTYLKAPPLPNLPPPGGRGHTGASRAPTDNG